jgi:hypothetical protein
MSEKGCGLSLDSNLRERLEEESIRVQAKGGTLPFSLWSGGKTNHSVTRTPPGKGIFIGTMTHGGEVLQVYKM